MRILVAEDDAALRSVLERGLRENGYVVDAVADGTAALRHMRAYEYDVAVLDWRMPERAGIEVVAEARSHGNRTPILMLTARDTPADRVAGLNEGADDYLVKPFDFAELVARCRRCSAGHHSRSVRCSNAEPFASIRPREKRRFRERDWL